MTRTISECDRRANALQLTDLGANLFETLLPVVRASQDEILGRLARHERDRLMELARKAI